MREYFVVLCICAFVLQGCARNISQLSYSVGSVGQVNRTVAGKVVNVREVDISGTSDIGGSAGAATGAIAGSVMGGNNIRANIVGTIGGAIAGGLAGAALEANATRQKGMEYVIETENATLMTIVQGMTNPLSIGANILVLYGSPARIIEDPRPHR